MLGTGAYAVPLLAGLYNSDHDVVGVFTRPEIKKNKKGVLPPSPVRARADLEGTKVFSPQDQAGILAPSWASPHHTSPPNPSPPESFETINI